MLLSIHHNNAWNFGPCRLPHFRLCTGSNRPVNFSPGSAATLRDLVHAGFYIILATACNKLSGRVSIHQRLVFYERNTVSTSANGGMIFIETRPFGQRGVPIFRSGRLQNTRSSVPFVWPSGYERRDLDYTHTGPSEYKCVLMPA